PGRLQVRGPVLIVDDLEDLLVARLPPERLHGPDPAQRLDKVDDHQRDRLAGTAGGAGPRRAGTGGQAEGGRGGEHGDKRGGRGSSTSRITAIETTERAASTRSSMPPSTSSEMVSISDVSRATMRPDVYRSWKPIERR